MSVYGFIRYVQPQIQSLDVITSHVTPTQDGSCDGDGLSVAGLRGCQKHGRKQFFLSVQCFKVV